jgi:hypothetical protein
MLNNMRLYQVSAEIFSLDANNLVAFDANKLFITLCLYSYESFGQKIFIRQIVKGSKDKCNLVAVAFMRKSVLVGFLKLLLSSRRFARAKSLSRGLCLFPNSMGRVHYAEGTERYCSVGGNFYSHAEPQFDEISEVPMGLRH